MVAVVNNDSLSKYHAEINDDNPKGILKNVLFDDPLSVFNGYCRMEDCFNLELSGNTLSSGTLKRSITIAGKKEITHFVSLLRKTAKTGNTKFEELVSLFFKYAPTTAHKHFFSSLTNEDDDFLIKIIEALPKDLTHLSLSHCKKLKDRHVTLILERLDNLVSLNLSHCRAITNAAVIAIIRCTANKSMNIKSLNLSHCKNITNAALGALSRSLSMAFLESLKFAECQKITNEGGMALIQNTNLVSLKKLNLRGCKLVTPDVKNLIAATLRQNALCTTLP